MTHKHIVVHDNFSVVGGILRTILNYVDSITDTTGGTQVTASNFDDVFPVLGHMMAQRTREFATITQAIRSFGSQVLADEELWRRLPASVHDGVGDVPTTKMKSDLAAALSR